MAPTAHYEEAVRHAAEADTLIALQDQRHAQLISVYQQQAFLHLALASAEANEIKDQGR